MATLYEELVAAGIPTCNHCSDLYFQWTPASKAILKRYPQQASMASRFTSQAPEDNKALWCDVPFSYDPFWERVANAALKRQRDAEAAGRTDAAV